MNVNHCSNVMYVILVYACKKHLRNHLKDYKVSVYVCDHCNKKFCQKPDLKDCLSAK